MMKGGIEVSRDDPTQLFQLVELLGKGSYGQVYKARNTKNSTIVAVKVLALEEDDDALDDVRKEIDILKSCDNPNIVKYYGSFMKYDNLWISMEYCGAGSVTDICQITESAMTEPQIALICKETLQGLAYLHSVYKIHRDIKGGNILLTDNGDVKLADFGVSAQLASTLSKRNTFVGTPYWMAPEVIKEESYNGTADVWSLGITAIEMAEIVPPLADVHPMRVLFMIPRDPPPKLKDPKAWSPLFQDFLAKCLVKDPSKRPAASHMLSHKFLKECNASKSILIELVDKCKDIIAKRGYRVYESDEENDEIEDDERTSHDASTIKGSSANLAASSSSAAKPLAANNDNNFNNNINNAAASNVNNNNFSTVVRNPLSVEEVSNEPAFVKAARAAKAAAMVANNDNNNNGITSSTSLSSTSSTASSSSISPSAVDFNDLGMSLSSSPSKYSDQNSMDSFGMNDRLVAMYRKGCTLSLPFLTLDVIHPVALTSKNNSKYVSTLKTLSSTIIDESQISPPKGPLQNLVRILAYHQRFTDESLPSKEREYHSKVETAVSTTLKTILKI